jgi:hypothetical protein
VTGVLAANRAVLSTPIATRVRVSNPFFNGNLLEVDNSS